METVQQEPMKLFNGRVAINFCSTCEVHCDMTDDLAHVLNCKVQTIEARQSAIIGGKIALKNSKKQKSKLLGNLTKQELELEQELSSKQIFRGE